jgi:hypothetical protein
VKRAPGVSLADLEQLEKHFMFPVCIRGLKDESVRLVSKTGWEALHEGRDGRWHWITEPDGVVGDSEALRLIA